ALATGEPQRIVPVAAARAEYAWLHGDVPGVAREVRGAFEYAVRDRDPWRVGELAYWARRGGVGIGGGPARRSPLRLPTSGEHRKAGQAWAKVGCRDEQAFALSDCSDTDPRKRALEIFDGLGARPMAARLRRQLKAEGVRGLKRGANRSTRANAAGLTVREL